MLSRDLLDRDGQGELAGQKETLHLPRHATKYEPQRRDRQGDTVGGVWDQVPLTVERGAKTIAYSVPAATVELELLPGADGGPVTVQNLPSRWTDYVQYKSRALSHRGDDATSFEFSGTNGFRARYTASS